MRTTIQGDRLKVLFQSFRDRNDTAFMRTAESIIAEELAANRYASATELQRALGKGRENMANGTKMAELATLPPKDRRGGEDLMWLTNPNIMPVVFLMPPARNKIDRILEEHRRGNILRKNGYAPKTKLLFWGPPGCGKTLTAQYIAYELGLPLGVVRLNAVISSFLGDTAAHLHRIFMRANSTPMVLLLDEADALAKQRDDPNDVGELKRVVNSFLQAMDAFTSSQSILIAASNHQYLFDPALWRRFDDIVEFPYPEPAQRKDQLKYLLNGVKFQGDLSLTAQKLTSLSFAEIERIVVEAVKTMLLSERDTVSAKDLTNELQTWKKSVRAAQKRQGAPK
jgi:SpoVK/Ycf46/Vps4 family AAA+-type ATPase